MFKLSNSSLALGLILAGGIGLSTAASAASSAPAFSMTDLSQGYTLASADQVKKPAEGKCGEDKFAKTDTDHDGKVSRAEFIVAAPDRAAEFDKIDADGDGGITLPEAEKYLADKAGKTTAAEGKCGEGKCGAAIES